MNFVKLLIGVALACASIAQAATYEVKFAAAGYYFNDPDKVTPFPLSGSFTIESDPSSVLWWVGEVTSFELTINNYKHTDEDILIETNPWSEGGLWIYGARDGWFLQGSSDDFALYIGGSSLSDIQPELVFSIQTSGRPRIASDLTFAVTAVPEVSAVGLAAAGLIVAALAVSRRKI